jgi:hypothetical protein
MTWVRTVKAAHVRFADKLLDTLVRDTMYFGTSISHLLEGKWLRTEGLMRF